MTIKRELVLRAKSSPIEAIRVACGSTGHFKERIFPPLIDAEEIYEALHHIGWRLVLEEQDDFMETSG